ncbi:MAG: hypothetical protein J6N74_02810 [Chryseobacterium sp.]|nr:hypothetical protein [Chryseobacterium sp.]
MSLTKYQYLPKIARLFFFLSLLVIIFSFTDTMLKWYEVIELTIPYPMIWLTILLITLVLLAILEKWKNFILILLLEILNFIFVAYVLISNPISQERPVQNSNYLLRATAGDYKVLKQGHWYKKVIAKKGFSLFFTPNMKTALVPYFKVKLLSETDEQLILEVQTSGQKPISIDTIQKLSKSNSVKRIQNKN